MGIFEEVRRNLSLYPEIHLLAKTSDLNIVEKAKTIGADEIIVEESVCKKEELRMALGDQNLEVTLINSKFGEPFYRFSRP